MWWFVTIVLVIVAATLAFELGRRSVLAFRADYIDGGDAARRTWLENIKIVDMAIQRDPSAQGAFNQILWEQDRLRATLHCPGTSLALVKDEPA